MKRTKTILGCAFALLLCGSFLQGQPAWASQVRYDLADGQLGAFVTIDDDTEGQIAFTIAVNELLPFTFIGDIRGLFFDLAPYPAGLAVTDFYGPDITFVSIAENAVISTSKGNTLTPYGPFDVGVEFGTPGIGKDDIRNTVFQIIYSGDLGLDAFIFDGQQIGLRLTSVGDPEGEREDSSKMFLLVEGGVNPASAVPAPASFLLISASLIALLGGTRRE